MPVKRAQPKRKKKVARKAAPPKRVRKVSSRATPAREATFQPAERVVHPGACHCGAIEFTFATSLPPARWPVRTCQCTFCRTHGARTTSDPEGEVQFSFVRPELLKRYRFGLRTAEFLVCTDCGAYVGAVLLTGRGAFATININALRDQSLPAPPGKLKNYDGETVEARRARRAATWTPVSGPV